MSMEQFVRDAMTEGGGILRMVPNWVPRQFCRPGRRLRLHPDDYFALGLARGGIDERWFASTVPAENGPLTAENEGLSFIVKQNGDKMLLRDAVDALKGELIGEALYEKYGCWPMYSKFFDNQGPLPHHVHQTHEYAERVGAKGKPEMYFFPSQYNNYGAEFPYTFFGLNPGVEKDELEQALENYPKGDNHLLELSRAYKLRVDTGWDVPMGVLHAPGSLCTYEPQFASDVFAMYQSLLLGDHAVDEGNLWKNSPEEEKGNYHYLMGTVDWDLNVDPDFMQNRYMEPIVVKDDGAIREEWICYRCPVAGAKRVTVAPGQAATYVDEVAYGALCVQGYGRIGALPVAAPYQIRYGQLTDDEFFMPVGTAKAGVRIENHSKTEPLVMLIHFAEHPGREAVCK